MMRRKKGVRKFSIIRIVESRKKMGQRERRKGVKTAAG